MTLPATPVAIVRPPGDCFREAVSTHPERDRIDPERARLQHAAYCRLLEAAGMRLVRLPPDEAHPDACFTQDTAVVVGSSALLARFGVPTRSGEEEALRPLLTSLAASLAVVAPPATLEGGDVLCFRRRIVVGRSRRTNPAGAEVLRVFGAALGYEVVSAEIPAWALHLSTAATVVGDDVAIGAPEVLAQKAFEGLDRVVVPDDQRLACNVWSRVDDGHGFVIAAGDFPVHEELRRRGFEVHPTDLSEFNRADGSPTCLSLVVGCSTRG